MARLTAKRVLSDEEEDSQQPMRKISKNATNGDSDAPTSGTQLTRKNPDHLQPEGVGRPKRSTSGQGGAAAQLAKIGDQLRPDLQGKNLITTKTAKNIPNKAGGNPMAPQPAKPRASKKNPVPTKTLHLRKEDPPLGTGAPKPTPRNVEARNTPFGHQPEPPTQRTLAPAPRAPVQPVSHTPAPKAHRSAPAQAPRTSVASLAPASQQHTNHAHHQEQGKQKRTQVTFADNSPLPPAKARISERSQPLSESQANFDTDIVPDSEEERNTQAQSQAQGLSSDNSDPGEDYGNYDDYSNYNGYISNQKLQQPDSGTESERHKEGDDGRASDPGHNDASDPYNPSDLGAEYDRCMAAEAAEQALDPHANDSGEDEPIQVDEVTPDEEDERNTQALHGRSKPAHSTDGEIRRGSHAPYSVLARHHATNRKIRPPTPANLTRSPPHNKSTVGSNKATSQTTEKRSHTNPLHAAGDEADVEESDEDEPPTASTPYPPAPSNNKGPTRTQEGFYPFAWLQIIDGAKNKYRLILHTGQSGFRERTAKSLNVARQCVLDSIDDYYEDPCAEDLDDEYFDQSSLAILVFQDGANYRGQMKAKAREILLKHFTDLQAPTTQDPDFDWDACHRRIGACAKALLVDGYFLRGGFDINGKTRNFSHPALIDLCRQFYYGNKTNCLAHLFPTIFEDLPRSCLSMACACFVNCLREFETGIFVPINFEGKIFGPVQNAMQILIESMDTDDYHGAQFNRLLREVARGGRANSGRESNNGTMGFAVVFD